MIDDRMSILIFIFKASPIFYIYIYGHLQGTFCPFRKWLVCIGKRTSFAGVTSVYIQKSQILRSIVSLHGTEDIYEYAGKSGISTGNTIASSTGCAATTRGSPCPDHPWLHRSA